MASNWRQNVSDSGLTSIAYATATQVVGKWKKMARLNTPFYVGPYLIEAVAQFENSFGTTIALWLLLEGTYPDGFPVTEGYPNVSFPGPFDVVPDHPVIAWD